MNGITQKAIGGFSSNSEKQVERGPTEELIKFWKVMLALGLGRVMPLWLGLAPMHARRYSDMRGAAEMRYTESCSFRCRFNEKSCYIMESMRR